MDTKQWRLWLGSLLAVSALALTGACGDDDGDDDDDVQNACSDAIAERAAEVADQIEGWPIEDAPEMTGTGDVTQASFAGNYRDDLDNHLGCAPREAYDGNVEFLIADNMATVPSGSPANITGYPCAAKVYDQPSEDTDKPIVILVHGNSASVTTYEEYFQQSIAGTERATFQGFTFTVEAAEREMLVSKLLDEGYPVIAFDARVDTVASQEGYNPDAMTGNAFRNIDHGWAVPMLQSLIRAVYAENPGRRVSLLGHSLGATVVRDALRRLYVEWKNGEEGAVNPFARLEDVILASGANHGVANGQLICDGFPNQMRGTVTCEMGDRGAFSPTYFTRRLNGPDDLFATPCADGSYAYGEEGQCEGNEVDYTTITMEDLPSGELQDEFVSEASSGLDLEPCVDNVLIGLNAFDASGYFFTGQWGIFASHFGSVRADAGMAVILEKLAD